MIVSALLCAEKPDGHRCRVIPNSGYLYLPDAGFLLQPRQFQQEEMMAIVDLKKLLAEVQNEFGPHTLGKGVNIENFTLRALGGKFDLEPTWKL